MRATTHDRSGARGRWLIPAAAGAVAVILTGGLTTLASDDTEPDGPRGDASLISDADRAALMEPSVCGPVLEGLYADAVGVNPLAAAGVPMAVPAALLHGEVATVSCSSDELDDIVELVRIRFVDGRQMLLLNPAAQASGATDATWRDLLEPDQRPGSTVDRRGNTVVLGPAGIDTAAPGRTGQADVWEFLREQQHGR